MPWPICVLHSISLFASDMEISFEPESPAHQDYSLTGALLYLNC